MFRLYSKRCEYALRALLEAAPSNEDKPFQAKKACRKARIPEPFTRKVLQALVQGGFLKAIRGPGGGYILSAPPSEISLLRIIRAVDGNDTFGACIMGLPSCGGKNPCPLHGVWASAKEQLLEQLEAKTLQDLLDVRKAKTASKPPKKRK